MPFLSATEALPGVFMLFSRRGVGRKKAVPATIACLTQDVRDMWDERDGPVSRATIFQFPIPFFEGVAEAALYCARRTTTASSWEFREHRNHTSCLPIPF